MENKVTVSIIMPSLNSKIFIRECLESVLSQSMKEIEVICVDAGSTDGTKDILQEYALMDSRIKILDAEFKSYGYQINMGIDKAIGEYIGIVETDDFIADDMFEKLYSYARKDKPDFVRGTFYRFITKNNENIYFENKRSFEKVDKQLLKLNNYRALALSDFNYPWVGIYKKSFFKESKLRLNETPGASYQDTSFSILVSLLADTGIYVPDAKYYYRIDNSGSSVKALGKYACVIDEFEYVKNELIKRKLYTNEMKQLLFHKKLIVYDWNMSRLVRSERESFRELIKDELKEYKILFKEENGLDEVELEMYERLTDKSAWEKYQHKIIQRNQKYQELYHLLKQRKKTFVLFGTGAIGSSVIFMQRLLGNSYIDYVVDNNKSLQGKEWNSYIIQDIAELVNQLNDSMIIVANKKHNESITVQLKNLGILEKNIFVMNNSIAPEDLISVISEEKRYDV